MNDEVSVSNLVRPRVMPGGQVSWSDEETLKTEF